MPRDSHSVRYSASAQVESVEARTFLSVSPLHAGAAKPLPNVPRQIALITARPQLHAKPQATTSPTGFSPAQIRKAYGFDQIVGDGAGQTIAIVSAYDDPNIAGDLAKFSSTFSLPAMNAGGPTFTISKPRNIRTDAGWALETSLDVEWAHAIAPRANILLVESKDSSLNNLLSAVNTARNTAGVSVVSMSWGAGEFSSESSYDSYFTTPSKHNGVTFVAASGDNGAPAIWPSASPKVVAVGGTSLSVDAVTGAWASETGWSGSGGGISAYESKPSYQSSLTFSDTRRVVPDVAYDADPNSGVSVYDSVSYNGQSGWFQVGGTSAGSPQWAAYMAIVNQTRVANGKPTLDGSTQTLPLLYSAPSGDFHDIASGSSTGTPSYSAAPGFDLVTGRGSLFGDVLIKDLLA